MGLGLHVNQVIILCASVTQMREGIVISYRRDDARGASGRLYDWLPIGFGRAKAFRDVGSIGVGKWRDKDDTRRHCRAARPASGVLVRLA
jgi:hypothetical protein